MKILFVVEHFHPYIGGAETLWINLTTELVKAGHQVTVVTTLHDKSLAKKETFKGVDIVRVNAVNRYFFTFLSIAEIKRQIKDADLIHTASYNAAVPASIVAWIFNKKIIITFHEVWGKLWFSLPFVSKPVLVMYYLYEAFILKLPFHQFVAVSNSTATRLKENGIAENKISVILNGLEYETFKPYPFSPPQKFTFCFFGRLGISKGLDILLNGSKPFLDAYPDATLRLIIPTYPAAMYNNVLQLIDKLKLKDRIELLHDLPKEELFKQVSTSSCVVVTSHSEGFCFTAAETVGMGVPIISSDKGALTEVVSGKHLKLKELNAKELQLALEKAYNNEWDETERKEFHLSNTIHNYLNLYASI